MKKIVYFLSILTFGLIVGCEDSAPEETVKRDLPQGMIEYDLTAKGLPLVVVIPDTVDQPVMIDIKDWGETTISVGKYFQIQIAEGGDMALRKSDLAEDLLYKATYIVDEPDAILYKQEIEDGGIKPAYHFYLIKTIDNIQYEIQDIKGETFYPEKAADRMLQSAKLTIPAKKPMS